LAFAALAQNLAVPYSGVRLPSVEGATRSCGSALGFTTTLVNQDFSPGGLDLGCHSQSQRHFWSQKMEWETAHSAT
jgi:hypothetical protein